MKFYSVRFGLARSLVALAVSFALLLSTFTLALASPSGHSNVAQKQTSASQNELQVTSVTATAAAAGVVVQWRTSSAADNVGFNVYRLKDGRRTRVNREMIPGALFAPGTPALMRGGYSYSWFDRGGTADSTYFIESVNVQGNFKIHETISAVVSKTASGFEQTPEALSVGATESTDVFEKNYPAAEYQQPSALSGTIQEQWAIAAQSALKIAIKKDGWYRVTQPQMVAAGFNPTVDIRNLRLFVDANEVAISTNQFIGPFGSGDYIEFYGRGLDVPTTDVRTYYLIAGTIPGKRVRGEIQLDTPPVVPPGPTSTPPAPVTPPGSTPPLSTPPPQSAPTSPVLRNPIFFSWALRDLSVWADSLNAAAPAGNREARENVNSRPSPVVPYLAEPEPEPASDGRRQKAALDRRQEHTAERGSRMNASPNSNVVRDNPVAANSSAAKASNNPAGPFPVPAKAARKFRKRTISKKKKRSRPRSKLRQQRHHVLAADGFAPANFDHTIERQDRLHYLANLLNGDAENFFGNVISTMPVNQTLTVHNPDLTAVGPATLEFALQGVMSQFGFSHSVNVAFNGTNVASLTFGALEHPVQTVSLPVALLQSGANTLTFTKTSTGEVCLVDYVRLTYPHTFKADSGEPCATPNRIPESLKFNLLGSQTLKVDGFCTPSVKLIDYTDPLAVIITRPASESSAAGYAITVPKSEPFSKEQRLRYAIQEGQFDQPAALSLNEPSTLNLNSNSGDFLIVSHKTFIPTFSANVSPINTSLVAQRGAQGFDVSVVDIEDVYDEFSYGLHGPQAIRDFLQHAATNWATPPRYVIFAGDSSLDPRNYQGSGSFDFVPTKLVDATFNETCADDWLTDFNNDGIADIPVGRLPVRTVADANLIISKIVNFTPVTPQSAMLVADDPTGYYFNFEIANDEVQALLPPSMTVQRVNVRTEGSPAQAKANVIAGFNQGRALVNYTGHGNVDVWGSSSIFSASDATALTNGNNLSFIVVMDCLNGYFQDPNLLSLSEAFLKAPNGGGVAAFASSGLTFPDGQHEMSERLYTELYGAQPIALGDAIKIAKGATADIDVRRTWIFFGDPSLKIR